MARSKRSKGAALVVEVLIIGLASIIILSVLYAAYVSGLFTEPRERLSYVDAVYCGSVVTIKNLGPYQVTVAKIVVTDPTGGYGVVPVNKVLKPGESISVTVMDYEYASIIGDGFEAKVIRNACR